MILTLKFGVILALFISCIGFVLPYTIQYKDLSRGKNSNEDNLTPKQGPLIGNYYKSDFVNGLGASGDLPPKIGVYARNFARNVLKVIGEGNSGEHLIVTLPELKVEDHIWDGKSISLDCTSEDYPVFWEYHGVGNPKVLVSTHRSAPDFYNESSYTYGATVTLAQTDYRQTGDYTCRSVHENHVLGSSVFLFVPGKHLFVANDGIVNETLNVDADENNHWVTFPCVVSSDDASVELFQQSIDGSLQKLPIGESLTYEPTEGFRLKWKGSKSMWNPWGLYMCVGGNSIIRKESLSLRLRPPTKKNALGNFGNAHKNENSDDSLTFTFNDSNRTVQCCSQNGNGPSPQMRLTSCTSMSDCYMASMNPSSCQEGQSVNKCLGDKVMVKMSDNCVAYELTGVNEAGILDCVLMGETIKTNRLQFSFDPEIGFVTKFTRGSIDTDKILSLSREDASNKKEPHKAIYFCNSNLFFFSHGLKWAIERTEGNMEFLPEESFPSKPSLSVDESQVSKVYCFAPVWDSKSEWRNVSMSVPR